MDNPEKTKKQEWLSNPKERDKRFGLLGLESSQKYSALTGKEKEYLELSDDKRDFIHLSASIINHKYNSDEKREYINEFMGLYDILSNIFISPDKDQSDKLNLALTDSILSLDIPLEKIQKLAGLMSQEDTPFFMKQMAAFKIQHPIENLASEFTNPYRQQTMSTGYGNADLRQIQSVALKRALSRQITRDENGKMYNAEMIIYRDLLKCAFESGGKNIEQFLSKLSGGEYMMRAITCWSDSDEPINRYYSDKDLSDLQTLIRQLHSMHYQTKSGEKYIYDTLLHDFCKNYGKKSITSVKREIQKIFDKYQPGKNQTLGDKVIQQFCHPLGIQSIAEAYEYLDGIKTHSWFRHREMIKSGKTGKIEKGDFVKSIVSSNYLPYILENGVLSKEYLGTGEASDCTPLDTDISVILEEPHGLRNALSKTSAAAFSDMKESENRHMGGAEESIFLILHNDARFERIDEGDVVFCKNKYEICGHGGGNVIKNSDLDEYDEGYWYEDDFGIRTGIPSSEIDYIATDAKSAQRVINAVKETSLYIPVTDLDGNLIFNPFNS